MIAEIQSEPRAIEERYRRVVELSPDAVLLFHRDRIVFVNPAGARLLGASDPRELVGTRVLALVHAGFQALATRRLRRLEEQGGTAEQVHERFVRLDGRELDVEVRSAALRFHDPGTGMIVFKPLEASSRELRGCDGGPVECEADLSPSPVVHSPAMHEALRIAREAAGSEATILLLGETGTGKELVADYIHRHSRRAAGPLVKVSCAALPEQLVESELFGHEKGAFTGADRRRLGRFELARHGTLLLDEVGELSPPMQVKLLRVLQQRTVERIGSGQPIEVDFRLVCATNRDLAAMVEGGAFRSDLFYRINVVPVRLPPLRERPQDIVPLARYFLEQLRDPARTAAVGFAPDALECLTACAWPGNVRQLRNAVECALILCKSEAIHASDLPTSVRAGSGPAPGASASVAPVSGPLKEAIRVLERDYILRALQRSDGDVAEAARALGLSRTRLYVRMKQHGLRSDSCGVSSSCPACGTDPAVGTR